jgi:hypothetical protein
VTSGRSRRRSDQGDAEHDEGPFVSFTDLFIGILFLFLILVAALMLMHQETAQQERTETQQTAGMLQQLQAKIDARTRLDARHAPFRLAMVYNVYQARAGKTDWTFSRTVQVFRAPNDLCLNIVTLRNNLNLAWKPSVDAENIPTADDQGYVRMGTPCTLSGSGEHWDLESETGGVERTAPDLYSGASVLHKTSGKEETVNIQYRILGIYDDYFRKTKGGLKPPQT